jgi:hypothetical protein
MWKNENAVIVDAQKQKIICNCTGVAAIKLTLSATFCSFLSDLKQ